MKKANTRHNNTANMLGTTMLSVVMLSVTFYLIHDFTEYWTVIKKVNTQHKNARPMC